MTTTGEEGKNFLQKVEELNTWFEQNANLPQKIEAILLKRFLKCMHNDVEEAKRIIELNYSMRKQHAHIYINRDPQDNQFSISREINTAAPLPGLTPERYKIFCYRLEDSDPAVINNAEELKIFYMLSDCRFSMPDDDQGVDEVDNLADGDVQIMDIKNFTMRHVARISFLLLRMHLKFLQEAYPVRLKAMHIINCPSIFDKMLAIAKPFIREDVFKMIHFHTNGLESLYDYVPRDMLPEDYGGKAPKLLEIKAKWTQIIQDKRDYLMDTNYWITNQNETKRSRWAWW